MKLRAKVYSYLRFSDPKQAAGGSADRQREYATRWAAERGMALDDELSLFDEGLSAYHQRHVTRGALGTFLRAVEDGLVPSGSILIVESLDRLSRAEPVVAQAQLSQIVNAGITVVTASDNREYNREKLKAQPMDLVYSLLVMIRAHEESETKSKRVKAAIRRQCQGWIAGTYRGLIRNGHDPEWLDLVEGKFKPAPERVKALKLAIKMYREGHGHVVIARRLGEQGLCITASGNMAASHLYKIIRSRTLLGEKNLEIDGEEFRLEGYYPAVLKPEEFADLQHQVIPREKRMKGGDSAMPGVVTGIGIAVCGYCGGGMRALTSKARLKREDGGFNRGHMRVICHGNVQSVPCPVLGSCSVAPIERAIIEFCSDQMNLTRLSEEGDRTADVAARLYEARTAASDLQGRIERITEAMADAGTSPALTKKLRESEDELQKQLGLIQTLENDHRRAAAPASKATAKEWKKIAKGVYALDYEARKQARLLVADTFSRIQIFHRGMNPSGAQRNESGNRLRSRKGLITVGLISKAGNMRTLQVDRQTGDWHAMEDFHSLPVMPSAARELVQEKSTTRASTARVAPPKVEQRTRASKAPARAKKVARRA